MHPNKGLRKGSDIATRLHALGAAILSLARELPSGVEMRHVSMQLVRAGTACGANYEEARGAQSRADFIHKISIAAKEARETVYWLELLVNTCPIEIKQRSPSRSSTFTRSPRKRANWPRFSAPPSGQRGAIQRRE
jgi:four helix bundle protein